MTKADLSAPVSRLAANARSLVRRQLLMVTAWVVVVVVVGALPGHGARWAAPCV